MKSILILTAILFLIGCSRSITPYQAANKGGTKCGKYRLK